MKRDNLFLGIGLFVTGAFLLTGVLAFVFLNEYFQRRVETYVMFFKGSLQGLEASSAITYRGVKIGQVRRIELTANEAKTNVSIPVYTEFFVEKSFGQKDSPIEILIEKGLVASITSPNLLTGTASIELISDTKPLPQKAGKPMHFSRYFHGYRIFPTEQDNDDEPDNAAKDTLLTARKTLRDISKFINSKEFNDTVASIGSMAHSVEVLAKSLDDQAPQSLLYFNQTLQQITKTAFSTRSLTDYLSRHPESLLRGKP